jgi:hypothetical protein
VPPPTPEEFEATRKACTTMIVRHERVVPWENQRLEAMMVTRAVIEHSRIDGLGGCARHGCVRR